MDFSSDAGEKHRLLGYNGDWTCLVGQYKYSTRKEYKTTLNEEQIKIFIQILLSPSAFSIGKSISLTETHPLAVQMGEINKIHPTKITSSISTD